MLDHPPFATSVEGHSHIALKVPCNEDGSPKITIVTGIAPKLNTLDVGNAINNGTLDERALDLSDEGRSCLYHYYYHIGLFGSFPWTKICYYKEILAILYNIARIPFTLNGSDLKEPNECFAISAVLALTGVGY